MQCQGVDQTPDSMEPGELHEIRSRVLAEFREMPGLVLTLPQAVRLFGVDSARCRQVLDMLVEHGVLSTNGRTFARVSLRRHRSET